MYQFYRTIFTDNLLSQLISVAFFLLRRRLYFLLDILSPLQSELYSPINTLSVDIIHSMDDQVILYICFYYY